MNPVGYIFKRVGYFFWRYMMPPEKYARHIGVTIGKNCFIATREWGNEPYLITVGNNVQIARNVAIHTHGGGHCARYKFPDFDIFGKVVIGDGTYIGFAAQIMPGVTIGEGALVAAGSIVTKSVLPHTVVAGNPARFLCTIEEYIVKNQIYNAHTCGMPTDKKKQILLSMNDEEFIKK